MNAFSVISLLFLALASCKVHTKPLTESMGQEVIEIGAPLKELPPDLDEEPGTEMDDMTSTTLQAATRNKQTQNNIENNKISSKDSVKQEDDEARIEKELAEMYKDTDYKGDSGEVTTRRETTTVAPTTSETSEEEEAPIERSRDKFKFQPDENNPKAIAKFRTSIDEISCERRQLAHSTVKPNEASRNMSYTWISAVAVAALLASPI